jgi:hypothetical protein
MTERKLGVKPVALDCETNLSEPVLVGIRKPLAGELG